MVYSLDHCLKKLFVTVFIPVYTENCNFSSTFSLTSCNCSTRIIARAAYKHILLRTEILNESRTCNCLIRLNPDLLYGAHQRNYNLLLRWYKCSGKIKFKLIPFIFYLNIIRFYIVLIEPLVYFICLHRLSSKPYNFCAHVESLLFFA